MIITVACSQMVRMYVCVYTCCRHINMYVYSYVYMCMSAVLRYYSLMTKIDLCIVETHYTVLSQLITDQCLCSGAQLILLRISCCKVLINYTFTRFPVLCLLCVAALITQFMFTYKNIQTYIRLPIYMHLTSFRATLTLWIKSIFTSEIEI